MRSSGSGTTIAAFGLPALSARAGPATPGRMPAAAPAAGSLAPMLQPVLETRRSGEPVALPDGSRAGVPGTCRRRDGTRCRRFRVTHATGRARTGFACRRGGGRRVPMPDPFASVRRRERIRAESPPPGQEPPRLRCRRASSSMARTSSSFMPKWWPISCMSTSNTTSSRLQPRSHHS